MSKLTLPIQAGKRYRMRDGRVTTVRRIDRHLFVDNHPRVHDGYVSDGRRGSAQESPFDLVADVPECETCNDHGMIGGPSFSDPGEGGVPCPDCAA